MHALLVHLVGGVSGGRVSGTGSVIEGRDHHKLFARHQPKPAHIHSLDFCQLGEAKAVAYLFRGRTYLVSFLWRHLSFVKKLAESMGAPSINFKLETIRPLMGPSTQHSEILTGTGFY